MSMNRVISERDRLISDILGMTDNSNISTPFNNRYIESI